MARYKDADKLKDNFCDACATLKRYGRTVEECRNKTDSYGNKCFKMRLIDATPTADVVSKSEFEKLVQDGTRLGQENEILKDNNEHLAVMLEEAKSEVERLQAEKDALIKNYAECMKDYASEIFADVNMRIISYSTDIYIKGEELIIIPKSDYNAILAALIKKYTEGEDKPAATEEKYFSPEDVRKMTNQEVREKYTAIRKSMERW